VTILDDALKMISNLDPSKVGAAIGTAASDPSRLIEEISIESAYTPVIRLKRPLAQGKPGGFDPLAYAKPRITVNFTSGTLPPAVLEPWGSPPPTKWPIIRGVAIAGALFVGFFTVRGLTCSCRRKA
jgi:hypothetical protein